MTFADDIDWQNHSACRDDPEPDLWFSNDRWAQAEAKSVCRHCPVAARCLKYAFDHEMQYGIWGGVSGRQRAMTVRRRA